MAELFLFAQVENEVIECQEQEKVIEIPPVEEPKPVQPLSFGKFLRYDIYFMIYLYKYVRYGFEILQNFRFLLTKLLYLLAKYFISIYV